jgi:GWxTD domain-containing protein
MSLFHLVFTVSLVSSLPPVSATASVSTGEIAAVADPVLFLLADTLYYLAIFYSVDPDCLERGEFTAELRVEKEGAKPFVEEWKRKLGSESVLYLVDYRDVVLAPGKYTVSLALRSGEKRGSLSMKVEVPREAGFSASDVMFVSGFYEDPNAAPVRRGDVGFIPNPARTFWGDTLFYYFEVYGMSGDSGKYVVTAAVEGPDGKPLLATKPTVKPKRGETAAEAGKMNISALAQGEYMFVAEIVDLATGERVKLQKPFARKIEMDRYAADPIRSFIDYLATQEEMKEFKACANPLERQAFLDAFWAKRDPDPSTPQNEFYDAFALRVRYADEHFSQINRLGRYTDMGRIYIKYGPPDEITREEAPKARRAYIRWHYNIQNWEFLFADPNNTGEYQLVYSTNREERPTLFYDKPPEKTIEEELEEWYWEW